MAISHDIPAVNLLMVTDSCHAGLLGRTPFGLHMLDENGCIVGWNPYLRDDVLGLPEHLVAGFDMVENLLHPDDRGVVREWLRRVLQERLPDTVEARILSCERGGHVRWFLFSGNRMVIDGAVCVVGIGIDISGRKSGPDAVRNRTLPR